jgi:hypothetical protein
VRVEKGGGQISRNEMVAMLLFAGHETTTHLISGSVHEQNRSIKASQGARRSEYRPRPSAPAPPSAGS